MYDPNLAAFDHPGAIGTLMRIRLHTEAWLQQHPKSSPLKPFVQKIRNETEDALTIEKETI